LFTSLKVFDHPLRKEMAINFTVPEVSSSSYLLYLYRIPVYPQFILLNVFPFSSFVLLFIFKTIRIYPIKLSSLPISHTFNVLVH